MAEVIHRGTNVAIPNLINPVANFSERLNSRLNKEKLLAMQEEDRANQIKQQGIDNANKKALLGLRQDAADNAQTLFSQGQEDRANMSKVISNLGNVSTTTQLPADAAAVSAYQAKVAGSNDAINGWKANQEKYMSKDTPAAKQAVLDLQKLIDNESRLLGNYAKPTGSTVPRTRAELLGSSINTTGAKNPKELDTILQFVGKNTGSTGNMTPYQQYNVAKDMQKKQSLIQENNTLIKNNEGLFKNTKFSSDPEANSKIIARVLDKDYKAKGSITDEIGRLVTDEDSDNQANIAENSEELNKILKTEFKGNKKDMLQVIDGFYKRQGTGFFKNWGGGSPMGDALDNFIGKYK